MRQPPVEELVVRTGSRYAVVAIVLARARQLIAGDIPAVDTDARNPVTVALEELGRGRLRVEAREGESGPGRPAAKEPAPEDEVAVGAGAGGVA